MQIRKPKEGGVKDQVHSFKMSFLFFLIPLWLGFYALGMLSGDEVKEEVPHAQH